MSTRFAINCKVMLNFVDMPRTLIPYVGGKFYHAKWICQYLDYTKPTYVEPFFGGGSILWAKKMHQIEIVNDINAELMNLYLMLRDRYEEFVDIASFYHWDENMFKRLREEIKTEKDDLKRAVYFFLLSNMTFAGKTNWSSFGYKLIWNAGQTLWQRVKELKWFHLRLKNVQILNKDFRSILKAILENRQTNKVCIYADPPYIDKEHYYDNGFGLKDHEELAHYINEIVRLGGYAAVSYYEDPFIEKLYPKSKYLHLKRTLMKSSYYKQGIEEKPEATDVLIIPKRK